MVRLKDFVNDPHSAILAYTARLQHDQRANTVLCVVSFTVLGAPRTKKTSNRLVPGRGRKAGRKLVLPSAAWVRWVETAVFPVKVARLPDQPYSCRALFYRDRLTGDACGYYQGLADALEKWGVLSDDRFLVDWDGSRLLLDRKNPRVEITLTPVNP